MGVANCRSYRYGTVLCVRSRVGSPHPDCGGGRVSSYRRMLSADDRWRPPVSASGGLSFEALIFFSLLNFLNLCVFLVNCSANLNEFHFRTILFFTIFPYDTHGFSGSRPGSATVISVWSDGPMKIFPDLLIEFALPGSGALRTALLPCPSSFLLGFFVCLALDLFSRLPSLPLLRDVSFQCHL